jgi:hypothetical protein
VAVVTCYLQSLKIYWTNRRCSYEFKLNAIGQFLRYLHTNGIPKFLLQRFHGEQICIWMDLIIHYKSMHFM